MSVEVEVNWSSRVEELTELAYIDEADDYEVDRCGIYFDPVANDFVVLTASGCSCWDGEAFEAHFPSLLAIEEGLQGRKASYNPSLKGIETLLTGARTTYAQLTKGQTRIKRDSS